MGKFVTRKDDSLITYKIGQIFPSFHKKLIQTFISGLDAQRWSEEEKGNLKRDVLFTLLFYSSLFPHSFYLSLFVPDQSASLSTCLNCQYITRGPIFWLNEVSRGMSVASHPVSRLETILKLDFRF